MSYHPYAMSLTALLALTACGGGGSSGPSSVSPAVAPTTSTAALPSSSFSTTSRGAQSGFAGTNGRAVYDFDLDLTSPGTSSCTGSCALIWPPVAPPSGTLTAPFGTIVRPDGTQQLAYNGHPLYEYAGDSTTTAANGDGLNLSGGIWHLAQAAALTTPLDSAGSPSIGPTSSPY